MPMKIEHLKRGMAIHYQGRIWRIAQINLLFRESELVNGDVYPEKPNQRVDLVRPWNLWLVLRDAKRAKGLPLETHKAIEKRKRREAKREIWRDVIRSRRLSRKRGSDEL